MKYIIIPDSFKGTLSATEVCDIISDAIRAKDPAAHIISIPMADGGEGTCACFQYALGGQLVGLQAVDAYGDFVDTYYWRRGATAVIEMAAIAGFKPDGLGNPAIATTFGVGQLIKHAITNGCSDIILAIGGSATNDGGCGMLSAMGAKFADDLGREFLPTGNCLDMIADVDLTELNALISGVCIQTMCDVTNPLYGPNGAAYVFAPQKGASPEMVKILDENLHAFGDFIVNRRYGESVAMPSLETMHAHKDIVNIPGTGAAGGMGAGALAFLKSPLRPGAEIILDMVGFDKLCMGADMVITGEGSLDSQSLDGKVVARVAARARTHNIPVSVLAGRIALSIEEISALGISRAVASLDYCADPDNYQATCREDLRIAAQELMK